MTLQNTTAATALASTRARTILTALALSLILLSGCASRGPTQKEKAHAKWNEARARVLLNLASEQYAHGNLIDARKTTMDGLKISERVSGLYVLSAKLEIEAGQLQNASAALATAKKLAPNDPEPYYLTGIIAERWQKGEEALAAYRTASEKQPNELAYLLAMAEALVSLDRPAEAAAALEARLVFFESSAPIRDMLAQVYQELGRHQEAAALYGQASLLAPEDASLREHHALALMQAEQWREAADALEILVARPEHAKQASLYLALGECRMQQGSPDMARAAFYKATRLDSKSLVGWLGLGKASLETGELARVEFALQQAEALRPTGRYAADVALLRGYLALKQNQPAQAARSFSAANQLEPSDPMPLIMYGYCQQRMGRLEQAKQYYTRALELDPTDALARELMGSLATADVNPLP